MERKTEALTITKEEVMTTDGPKVMIMKAEMKTKMARNTGALMITKMEMKTKTKMTKMKKEKMKEAIGEDVHIAMMLIAMMVLMSRILSLHTKRDPLRNAMLMDASTSGINVSEGGHGGEVWSMP